MITKFKLHQCQLTGSPLAKFNARQSYMYPLNSVFIIISYYSYSKTCNAMWYVDLTGDAGSGDDDIACAVNLINDGVVVNGKSVTVQFVTIGSATSHLCRLDTHVFRRCTWV